MHRGGRDSGAGELEIGARGREVPDRVNHLQHLRKVPQMRTEAAANEASNV